MRETEETFRSIDNGSLHFRDRYVKCGMFLQLRFLVQEIFENDTLRILKEKIVLTWSILESIRFLRIIFFLDTRKFLGCLCVYVSRCAGGGEWILYCLLYSLEDVKFQVEDDLNDCLLVLFVVHEEDGVFVGVRNHHKLSQSIARLGNVVADGLLFQVHFLINEKDLKGAFTRSTHVIFISK